MRYIGLLLVTLFTMSLHAAPETIPASDSGAQIKGDSVAADTSVYLGAEPAKQCTLSIETQPDGATVTIDGKSAGISPVKLIEVDTGKHTVIIQKPGYFQKKAVLTLTEPGHTPLVFSLVAPGRLVIATAPDSAIVMLNGVKKGYTPYADSLLKPGTYQLEIARSSYTSILDTLDLQGGVTMLRNDTLHFTPAYTDSVAVISKAASEKKKRFTLSILAGSFGVFLLSLLIIENSTK